MNGPCHTCEFFHADFCYVEGSSRRDKSLDMSRKYDFSPIHVLPTATCRKYKPVYSTIDPESIVTHQVRWDKDELTPPTNKYKTHAEGGL